MSNCLPENENRATSQYLQWGSFIGSRFFSFMCTDNRKQWLLMLRHYNLLVHWYRLGIFLPAHEDMGVSNGVNTIDKNVGPQRTCVRSREKRIENFFILLLHTIFQKKFYIHCLAKRPCAAHFGMLSYKWYRDRLKLLYFTGGQTMSNRISKNTWPPFKRRP